MGLREAAAQVGYVVGAGVAGLALATTGYAGLGGAMGTFFVASALALTECASARSG